jgi:hypothetical protein
LTNRSVTCTSTDPNCHRTIVNLLVATCFFLLNFEPLEHKMEKCVMLSGIFLDSKYMTSETLFFHLGYINGVH